MTLYEVHPHGDLIITLHKPNAPFAEETPPEVATTPDALDIILDDAPEVATDIDDPVEDASQTDLLPQYRVSSSHLILSSGYFRRMLTGPWIESVAEDGVKRTSAYDWDEEAFLTLLNIIHGHNRAVPRQVSLDFVARIAVMVDYYQCHEAVELWFFDVWQATLNRTATCSLFDRDLTLRLFISWVFAEKTMFPKLTGQALWHNRGSFSTLGLAFPVDVIDKIESCRQELMAEAIAYIDEVLASLRENNECSFECSSMRLGALIKGLGETNIPFPLPTAPYGGLNLSTLANLPSNFKDLEWLNKTHKCSPYDHYHYGGLAAENGKCGCNLSSLLAPKLDTMRSRDTNLEIEGFTQSMDERGRQGRA